MKKIRWFFLSVFMLCASAHADDWGCEVLLCMSNPAGPMAVSACVPPITRLFDHLRHGGSFPTCAMGGSGNTGATHSFSNPRGNCPEQYTDWDWVEYGHSTRRWEPVGCQYAGVVTTYIEGKINTRVWWQVGGSVSEPMNGNTQASAKYLADYKVWRIKEDERLAAIKRAEEERARYSGSGSRSSSSSD